MKLMKKIKDKWIAVLIAIAAFAVFANTIPHQFVWDDYIYIVYRAEKGTELSVGNILSGKYPRNDTGVYRPVRNLFDAITFVTFGTNPLPYHVFVVAQHVILSVFVFWLIRELTEDRVVAAVAGFVFAVHPIHVEAVAWVMAGLDLLFVLFYIPAIIFYVKSVRQNNLKFLNYSWMLATISMFVNELAVTLPAVIMMIDYFVFGQGIKEVITSKKLRGFIAGFGFYWLCRFYFLEKVGQAIYVYDDFFNNFLLTVVMFGQYVKYILLPINLIPDHLFPNGLTSLFVQNHNSDLPPPALVVTDVWILFSLFISFLTIIIAWFLRKSKPLIGFGLLWVWVTLLPGLGVIPIVGIFAERRAYLASVGFALIFGVLIKDSLKIKRYKIIVTVLLISILTWYSWETINRNLIWRDSITLWSYTYNNNPASAIAAHGIAIHHSMQGDYQKALPYAQAALRLDPYGGTFQETINSLYINLKMWDELLAYFKFYLERDQDNADLLFRAGSLYEAEFSDYENARKHYEKVLEVLPNNQQAMDAIENLDSKKL